MLTYYNFFLRLSKLLLREIYIYNTGTVLNKDFYRIPKHYIIHYLKVAGKLCNNTVGPGVL